jgi:hypothetical protein
MLREDISEIEINTISNKTARLNIAPPMRLYIRRVSNRKNPDIKFVVFVFTKKVKQNKEEKFKLEIKFIENKGK